MKRLHYKGTNYTVVNIVYANELITYIEEYFTYDWQEFIAEIGGTFGSFLGFSMLTSMFDFVEFIQNLIWV